MVTGMFRIGRVAVALGAVLGLVLCLWALVASWVAPGFVERVATEVIRLRLESGLRGTLQALDERLLRQQAVVRLRQHADNMATIRRELESRVPEQVAAVIAEMADLNCACRQALGRSLREGAQQQWTYQAGLHGRLTEQLRAHYRDTAAHLTREFRIFFGSNALVFAVLLLALVRRRKAGVHLLPVALVLLVAAGLTAYLYVFRQDWLHTLLYADYLGLGYVAYLVVAFGLLSDVLFNGAQLTAQALSSLLQAIGSAASVLPC